MSIYEKKNDLFINKSYLICIFVVIITFLIDRISKVKIVDHQINNSSVYINDFINLELIWNTGIGFGIFSTSSSLFYNSISALIGLVIILLIYLLIKSEPFEKISFSLVIGGALGNFYDRIIYYAVPDFIDLHYKSFHWFTFNLADIFISMGIIMLIGKEIFRKNDK